MSYPTLKEKAYHEIRKLLIDRTIKPGDILTERSLVERLNMSRTPIRTALERLEVEGFIKQSPKQGILVLELSIEKVINIYDLRIALESHVVEKLSSIGLTESEEELLKDMLSKQKSLIDGKNLLTFTEEDTEFHNTLIKINNNIEVTKIMNNIQGLLSHFAYKVFLREEQRVISSYEDHVEIFESILRGDGKTARKKMAQHLDYGKKILLS